jgi:hypothetical protein
MVHIMISQCIYLYYLSLTKASKFFSFNSNYLLLHAGDAHNGTSRAEPQQQLDWGTQGILMIFVLIRLSFTPFPFVSVWHGDQRLDVGTTIELVTPKSSPLLSSPCDELGGDEAEEDNFWSVDEKRERKS